MVQKFTFVDQEKGENFFFSNFRSLSGYGGTGVAHDEAHTPPTLCFPHPTYTPHQVAGDYPFPHHGRGTVACTAQTPRCSRRGSRRSRLLFPPVPTQLLQQKLGPQRGSSRRRSKTGVVRIREGAGCGSVGTGRPRWPWAVNLRCLVR